MLHAWAAGRYITRRMRRARAPKRRRGAAGAFRGLLGLGISGRIMNFISLMNLISLIGGGHAAACPYRMGGGFNEPFSYYIRWEEGFWWKYLSTWGKLSNFAVALALYG